MLSGAGFKPGEMIAGAYRVEQMLGSGATTLTVAAHATFLRRPVTLKILAAYTDAQTAARAREVDKARVAANLEGNHVARIVDIGVTEHGMPFIATERYEGATLAAELEERGRLDVEEAVL